MAADEPPYLNIGTDVSAKYKGAFCEAKVKKVNRVVRCKVTFKNNLGSFVVTDDLIKGPLRIGADVEAKHPDKNQFFEAVINKLQDYSQYTVVFDDGDETTLRRTSLCLKSGRHFAESPTLDQFPLTNPEHFSTPVIGSGKFKRKRRSTINSSLDYESSDDDSLPRKLKAIRGKEKDPDLGKVVCVDYGDRRKKENWYPGLIVPLPPQSNYKILKEEHLIRSFKDGKYYQVPKRDIRDFTKECGQKIENNALRSAVEKATLYLEKEELPPHWDKVLFIGLGDDESNDSESDTSDDEPSEEKDRFVAELYKFMEERGTPINKAPTVSNRDLNLYKLFKIMTKLGGYNKVTNKNKWKTVYSKMGFPHSVANGPNQVKFAYKRYLQSFENFYRKLGCTMVNNTRSTRGRYRSDRNIIITRTRDRDTVSPKSKTSKEVKEKIVEKKSDDKPKTPDKKESRSVEASKTEEKVKTVEKKKVEEEKPLKEEKRRLIKKEDAKPEKARTREDARKEKNDSPEKKGTRSSSKVDLDKKQKEEVPKEKKIVKEKKDEKVVKDEKPKSKKEENLKDKKIVREKKVEEKVTKEKRENPVREKRDLSREKKEKETEKPKGKKEEVKIVEEKSPKRKLERSVKKESTKPKCDEAENSQDEKKEEKLTVEDHSVKKEDPPTNEEENEIKLEETNPTEDRKLRLKSETEEEPPNKGRKRLMKGDDKDDKASLFEFSDSDESDSEKACGKDLKKEIEVGDRVKVKYGRGRMQKVYEAKVLKTQTDGLEKRYYVHYAGWNMRYDEWVRKNYIVAIVSGNKKFEGISKNPLPPSSMKKQDRSPRLPGYKPVRKNSTSSSNSNVSRSTRSDKKEDADSKMKTSKKYDASAADTSQDSCSDREDDEDGNDADIEDSSAVQTDSCFKEELFSDDDEKEKPEDEKQEIAQLDKLLESAITSKEMDCISNDEVKEEENLEISAQTVAVKEETLQPPSDDSCTPVPVTERTDLPSTSEPTVTSEVNDVKTAPSNSDICQTLPCKPSVLSFSGLIQKTETPVVAESTPFFPESTFLPVFTSSDLSATPAITEVSKNETRYGSDIKIQKSESKDGFQSSKNVDRNVKDEISLEDSAETNYLAESNDSAKASLPCSDLLDCTKDTVEECAEVKDTKNDLSQNVFMPSFSPHNLDQPFNKSDANNQSETVDVSKMIPGILERLKNDDATEFDVDPPQKMELPFDFLRESSNKCMSRSDSSSSLRICESDTNDSNTDSKDMGFKHSNLAASSENCPAFDLIPKGSPSNGENDPSTLSKTADSSEKSNEGESIALSTESNVSEPDKSMSNSEPMQSQAVEEVSIKEEISLVDSCTNGSDTTEKVESAPSLKFPENLPSSSSCIVENEDTKDSQLNPTAQIDESEINFDLTNLNKPSGETERDSSSKEEVSLKTDTDVSLPNADSQKESIDPVLSSCFGLCSTSKESTPNQNSDSQPLPKEESTSFESLKNMAFGIKKEGKKKKFSKKLGKKSLYSGIFERESKLNKNKSKKKMRLEGFSSERLKSLDVKSKKKFKKNKNKKRFKHEDGSGVFVKKTDGEEVKELDKAKKKEKKKCDKKYLKCGLRASDGSDLKSDLMKKKKIKKNREKLFGGRKDYCEKKAKKKRKLHQDQNQDTDSDKEILPKLEKKRKKKKPKLKGCSSSDDGTDKFYKDEAVDISSLSHNKQDSKADDPDMSFLLCEEKVPASPVDVGNVMDDSSDSSSIEEDSSELMNINNTSTVMDNTPPTTPSSTESLLSSSPSHERDSFPYPESTQSCEGESDIFRCGSNRTISRGSEEYHAATTLAFDVCQTPVSEKPLPSDLLKQPPKSENIEHQLPKRKKKNKRFRRLSETSAKSPRHKLSYLRTSKVDNCYEESSGTSLATLSCSPPYGSYSFTKSCPSKLSPGTDDFIYVPLHEKDPEKRIALLQKRMTDLRKQYLSLRSEVIAIDHKRRKARKKVRETVGSTTAASPHSDEIQSCS